MLKKMLAGLAVATLALAGCSVDHSGQDASKPTIRIGYQTFPSGDLVVKNNKWLEQALPNYNIKWTKFDSGADVNTAFTVLCTQLPIVQPVSTKLPQSRRILTSRWLLRIRAQDL